MLNFFNNIIKEFHIASLIFHNVYFFLINLFNINIIKKPDDKQLKEDEKEKKIFFNYGAKNVREYYARNFFKNDSFKSYDLLWTKVLARKYLIKNDSNLFRSYFRILSSKKGFYFNFIKLKNKKNYIIFLINTFGSGLKYIWIGVRFWVFPLILFFSIIYFTLVLRALPFNKVMFSWICILMFVYWLVSGFVFFLKNINLENIQQQCKDFEGEVIFFFGWSREELF